MDYTRWIILGSMLMTGVVLLAVGGIIFMRVRALKLRGIKTKAVVVEFKQYLRTVAPVISFQTEQGELVTVTRSTASSRIFYSFRTGDEVQVYYDKSNPNRFCIEGDATTKFVVGVLWFMAAQAVALGVIGFMAIA